MRSRDNNQDLSFKPIINSQYIDGAKGGRSDFNGRCLCFTLPCRKYCAVVLFVNFVYYEVSTLELKKRKPNQSY